MATESFEPQEEASPESELEAIFRARELEIHTCIPGRIINVLPGTSETGLLVDVQIGVKRDFGDGPVAVATLRKVPVEFTRVSNFIITVPIKPGDDCRVNFYERCLDEWLAGEHPATPGDPRSHDYSDATVSPTLSSSGFSDYNPDDFEIRSTDGEVKICMSADGKFQIKNSENELLSLLKDLVASLLVLKVSGAPHDQIVQQTEILAKLETLIK